MLLIGRVSTALAVTGSSSGCSASPSRWSSSSTLDRGGAAAAAGADPARPVPGAACIPWCRRCSCWCTPAFVGWRPRTGAAGVALAVVAVAYGAGKVGEGWRGRRRHDEATTWSGSAAGAGRLQPGPYDGPRFLCAGTRRSSRRRVRRGGASFTGRSSLRPCSPSVQRRGLAHYHLGPVPGRAADLDRRSTSITSSRRPTTTAGWSTTRWAITGNALADYGSGAAAASEDPLALNNRGLASTTLHDDESGRFQPRPAGASRLRPRPEQRGLVHLRHGQQDEALATSSPRCAATRRCARRT